MRQRLTSGTIVFIVAAIMLGACNGNNPAPGITATPANIPALGWNKSPDSIIVRLDRQVQGESQVTALNRLPLCTLYGNGHLVWVNDTPPDGDQVLEAQLDDGTIRTLLDFAIKEFHFYSLPDYAANELQPPGNALVESIAVNLNDSPRTVRSYGHWPNNEFQTLLDKCTHSTTQPVLFAPTGAWLSVQPTVGQTPDSPLVWQPSQPFKLNDLAANGKPIWISGPLLSALWAIQRRSIGAVQWIDNKKSFRLILQIPGISRESPIAPPVTPTMAPRNVTATPTIVPTPS